MERSYKYKVALSFSGKQRAYAEEVNRQLKSKGVETFYDQDNEVELWGKHLIEEFHKIFEHESEYVILFISKEYIESPWARHELRSAISRWSQQKEGGYILPVRFDGSEIPGMPTDVAYLDINSQTPAEIAVKILQKIGINPSAKKSSDIPPPVSTNTVGEVSFDYSNHNGIYIIGSEPTSFETKWGKASNRSIYVYNDPPLIRGVAIAKNCFSIAQLRSANNLDFSSRHRGPQTGQIVVFQNVNGFYAAIEIVRIKDDISEDYRDELYFRYAIQKDGSCDFSSFRRPTMIHSCDWDGITFTVWPLQLLGAFSGVYIYTRLINNAHYIVYVGQSEDVGSHMLEHDQNEPDIWRYSDHIHGLQVPQEQQRKQIEEKLISSYNPPLNVIHRTGPSDPEIAAIIPDRWHIWAG